MDSHFVCRILNLISSEVSLLGDFFKSTPHLKNVVHVAPEMRGSSGTKKVCFVSREVVLSFGVSFVRFFSVSSLAALVG